MISAAILLYPPMLAFIFENPPVPATEKALSIESKIGRPAI